ncbi:hypothetical protein BH23ACT6_BH23ACT6_08500 [soil metagenome]
MAQEYQNVFAATQRADRGESGKAVWFNFAKADRRVTCFYFYLWDVDFGPAFIKVCAYFPYPVKVWLNGHEWAKRQADQAGIGFTELSNGFASCTDPAGLQAICDRLGPGTTQVFFERWMARLPLPLTEADHAAGYWWELSMRQIETWRHHGLRRAPPGPGVLRGPRGRQPGHRPPGPGRAHLRRHPRWWGRPPKVAPTYKTRIATRDTIGVTVNADYKSSRIKQYLKDGRALRIEPVINKPGDLGCKRRLQHLDEPRPRRVRSTPACSILNVSGRVVSLRAQPLSGSHNPP